MRCAIIIATCIAMAGCSTKQAEQSDIRAIVQSANHEYGECVRRHIPDYDDGSSDAATISRAIMSYCRDARRDDVKAVTGDETARIINTVMDRHDDLNLVLREVLGYRVQKKAEVVKKAISPSDPAPKTEQQDDEPPAPAADPRQKVMKGSI